MTVTLTSKIAIWISERERKKIWLTTICWSYLIVTNTKIAVPRSQSFIQRPLKNAPRFRIKVRKKLIQISAILRKVSKLWNAGNQLHYSMHKQTGYCHNSRMGLSNHTHQSCWNQGKHLQVANKGTNLGHRNISNRHKGLFQQIKVENKIFGVSLITICML